MLTLHFECLPVECTVVSFCVIPNTTPELRIPELLTSLESIAVLLVGRDLGQGRDGNGFKVHSKTSYQYGRLEQNPSRRPGKLYKTYHSDLAYGLRAQ